MNDMLCTIEPKSDQLNADDLLGGRTLAVKVTDVSILAGEQPVAIHYEGDNGKPYKPCKTMRRVIVTAWGSDANLYVGRRMVLYRDDKVTFGAEAVGGIRISHMSGIAQDMTIALTVSRKIRKPFTVKVLSEEPSKTDFMEAGHAAAARGTQELERFWKGLSAAERQRIGAPQLASWKRTASPRDNGNGVYDPETGEITADGGDPKLQALLDAGLAAATNGKAKFKRWENNLSAPDFERLGPHLDDLRKAASAADGAAA